MNHGRLRPVIVWRLYVAAVSVGLLAALLMTFFPPDITRYTRDGGGVFNIVVAPPAKGKQSGQLQSWLPCFGPGLLGVSFILQLVALLGARPTGDK